MAARVLRQNWLHKKNHGRVGIFEIRKPLGYLIEIEKVGALLIEAK